SAHEREGHRSRAEDTDQRDEVCLPSFGAREATKELLAALDTNCIQEKSESECSHHCRRDRLRRKPSDGESDKQDCPYTKRETLDVDLTDQITNRDRQEQRHQRLLLEKRPY